MNRKTLLTALGAMVLTLAAGTSAMAVNLGILDARSSDEVGELEVTPTSVGAEHATSTTSPATTSTATSTTSPTTTEPPTVSPPSTAAPAGEPGATTTTPAGDDRRDGKDPRDGDRPDDGKEAGDGKDGKDVRDDPRSGPNRQRDGRDDDD